MRTAATALAALLGAGCVSYEPALLLPAITLSAEEIALSANDTTAIDFGLELAPNESDSLFNVAILPGVLVRSVVANGPAGVAGIQAGDVILAVNEVEMNHPDTLRALQEAGGAPATADGFRFRVQRNTLVFEAMVIGRTVRSNAPPRELYRVDPLRSRAGYRTELVRIGERGSLAAARVVELLEDSPLPAAGIERGDLLLALDDRELDSAQDLVSRLNQDYQPGQRVRLQRYRDGALTEHSVRLWDPGRRISRISLGPLFQYRSSLNPPGTRLSFLDFWLFAVYRYDRSEGERSHSLFGLLNVSSDYGELVEIPE